MIYNDPFGFGDLSELFGTIDPQQAAQRGQEIPRQAQSGGNKRRGRGNGTLDQYGGDLTAPAKERKSVGKGTGLV